MSRGRWHFSKKSSLAENASRESRVVANWDQIELRTATYILQLNLSLQIFWNFDYFDFFFLICISVRVCSLSGRKEEISHNLKINEMLCISPQWFFFFFYSHGILKPFDTSFAIFYKIQTIYIFALSFLQSPLKYECIYHNSDIHHWMWLPGHWT